MRRSINAVRPVLTPLDHLDALAPTSAIYPRGANVQEGRLVLLTEDQLIKHSRYAWGYVLYLTHHGGGRRLYLAAVRPSVSSSL